MRKAKDQAPIDHRRLVDGFGEMSSRTHYEGFESKCGRCGCAFWFSATAQKYVHEVRGVPVKRARSAGFCDACAKARGKKNRAHAEGARRRKEIASAKAASDAEPQDGGKLLEYAVASIRALEQNWSRKSAERLLGTVRRAHRLDPKLRSAKKWERTLQALLSARDD